MGTISRKRFKRIISILLFCIVAVFVGHILYVHYFNKQAHFVEGHDTSNDTYMDVIDRTGTANTWLKRDYELNGNLVDLTGQTIDCILKNNFGSPVNSWDLTINIKGDCFINKAWNGTVEIHQKDESGNDKVQTLDLMKCSPDEVELKHEVHNGDLLIPLMNGDSVIYYPAIDSANNEAPVPAYSEVAPGIIFYYLDSFDISDYVLSFHYHKVFAEGIGFVVLIVLGAVFIVFAAVWIAAEVAYKNAEYELRLKQSGIASMSDIYSIIYYIDLEKDELTPIYADAASEKQRPKNIGAREQLLYMTSSDAEESYLPVTQEFIDIATVAERLDKGSIACEYFSRSHGWTSIRFFPADRVKDEPLKKVIFAIQDINEEKVTQKKYEELVEKEKHRNTYLAGVSGRTRSWLHKILELNEQIYAGTGDENIKVPSKQIRSIVSILSFTIDGGYDASVLAGAPMEKNEEEYSAGEIISGFYDMVKTMVEGQPVKVEKDISKNIPCRLKGDIKRIQRVLIQLLSDAVHYTEKGTIRFAVYGKAVDNREHLLISIKDAGGGIGESRYRELMNYIDLISENGPTGIVSNGHGLEVAACLLAFLGSKLNVISTPGEGTEFYFEIDQEIVDPTPISNN